MKHDDIERILADESPIAPSAGFLTFVMEAVEREAAAPRPLEFPWLRALPGLLATVAAFAAAIWHGIRALTDPVSNAAFDEQVRQLAALAAATGLHWLVLAMAIMIVSVMLPLGLLRSRSSSD